MKQTSNLLLFIIFIAIFLLSCDNKNSSSSENVEVKTVAFDLNEMRNKIQDKTNRFTEAHITMDTAYLNNSFTKDAKVFPPNSDVVIGRPAISQLNSDWVNYGIYEFKEESSSFYGNEDFLIDEGTYYLRYGEENTIDNGKYINIWKMEDGEWKIYSNIWNTSLAADTTE